MLYLNSRIFFIARGVQLDNRVNPPWLKFEFLKWVANDLCEPITNLFDLMAREGIPGFVDYYII